MEGLAVLRRLPSYRPTTRFLKRPEFQLPRRFEVWCEEKSWHDEFKKQLVTAKEAPGVGTAQLGANKRIEDRYVAEYIDRPAAFGGGRIRLAAVIDGHGGRHVAEHVKKNLAAFVRAELEHVSAGGDKASVYEAALKRAFLALDKDIRRRLKSAAAFGFSRVIKTGACCLAVLVEDDFVVVANCGDCEGLIIGRDGKTVELAVPQSANCPKEQERLRRAHPGEEDIVVCKRATKKLKPPLDMVVKCASSMLPDVVSSRLPDFLGYVPQALTVEEFGACYVKGRLMPSRSFGDFHLKEERFAYDLETEQSFVQKPYSFPYISAEPETFVHPRKADDQFLVLGSDGVWDFATTKEVAALVKQKQLAPLPSIASDIVQEVLAQAAKKREQSPGDILATEPGARRKLIDDTTCLVVKLNDKPLLR